MRRSSPLAVLALLSAVAVAGEGADLQAIHHSEWRRDPAGAIAALADGADVPTRVAATVALGRLQDPDALRPLVALRTDPAPDVRRAAAEALGFTPGSAPALRDWLEAEPSTARWATPGSGSGDLRAILLQGLGRQGDEPDVERLARAVAEPWPTGGAAAAGLARMGRRELKGVGKADAALVACLARFDPRLVESCAYALRRVGMSDAAPGDVATVAESWADAPTGPARAWLLRAVWPRLSEDQKVAAFSAGTRDSETVVRVCALDMADAAVGVAAVAPFLDDGQTWIRSAAVAAVGRIGGENAAKLLSEARARGGWAEADAIAAMAEAGVALDPAEALDQSRPTPVRAAIAGALADVDALTTLIRDPAPMVRSAAAHALVEHESKVPYQELLNMLGSEDITVRQAAIELLAGREKAAVTTDPIVDILVSQLRVDPDPDVLAGGFELLAARAARRPKDFDKKNTTLRDTLLRGLQFPDSVVREPAARLRQALNLDVGPIVRRDGSQQPDLDVVRSIRSARVFTDRGEFRITLLPDVAPLAVANFAKLAETDFYDGVVWHRVVPAFVVQTGDPRGDGSGGPGWLLPDEVSLLPYETGAVGMARAGRDTGGSQWFVALTPQPHLVGDYTLFGYVTYGMWVAKQLERGDRVLDVVIERSPQPP